MRFLVTTYQRGPMYFTRAILGQMCFRMGERLKIGNGPAWRRNDKHPQYYHQKEEESVGCLLPSSLHVGNDGSEKRVPREKGQNEAPNK